MFFFLWMLSLDSFYSTCLIVISLIMYGRGSSRSVYVCVGIVNTLQSNQVYDHRNVSYGKLYFNDETICTAVLSKAVI